MTLPRSIEALRHPLQTARLSRAFSQPPRQQYARRRGIAATTAKRDGGSGDEGDPDLQDNLVSMLRLQIGKKHVDAFVDAEEEKLKQSVEEVILIDSRFLPLMQPALLHPLLRLPDLPRARELAFAL